MRSLLGRALLHPRFPPTTLTRPVGPPHGVQGFLSADSQAANRYFDQAADCFQKASKHDPTNDSYRRALEMSAKARAWPYPLIHARRSS